MPLLQGFGCEEIIQQGMDIYGKFERLATTGVNYMRDNMHLGGNRPMRASAVNIVQQEVVEEEIFHPEAAKTDGNPFPEEVIDYDSLTVEELRALCRAKGLTVTGKKAELVARLLEADAPSEEAVEVTEDAPSEEAASSNETGSVSNESETETANTIG